MLPVPEDGLLQGKFNAKKKWWEGSAITIWSGKGNKIGMLIELTWIKSKKKQHELAGRIISIHNLKFER